MTLYDILEVSPSASDEVIKSAYRALSKKYHPDGQNEYFKRIAEDRMKQINHAYDILSNPDKRLEHDKFVDNEILEDSSKHKSRPNHSYQSASNSSSASSANSKTRSSGSRSTHQNQNSKQTRSVSDDSYLTDWFFSLFILMGVGLALALIFMILTSLSPM